MIFVTVCLLVGMVLGQRFKVLIVAPVCALTLIVAMSIGVVQGNSLTSIVMTSVAAIASLQVGYLIGASVRHLMVVARASSRKVEQTAPLPIPLRRTAA